MGRKKLIASVAVNNFTDIHPALDFYDGVGIIAVGGKWLDTYDDGQGNTEEAFSERPVCVLSNGDKFHYSPKELATRRLFHTGKLDIPHNRWQDGDIEEFCKDNGQTSLSFLEVFNLIQERFNYYMEFNKPVVSKLLSLFVIYTYFYPLFSMAPVLQLWGEFRTGKSKILSIIEALAFNPVNSSNITGSSIFRIVESRRSTILLDESEDLISDERSKDIVNMLLAGTGKSGEAVRQEKSLDETYHTQTYKVFSPKVIANIAGIQLNSLQSRIIRITTEGTSNRKKLNREVDQEAAEWAEIRNQLYRLTLCRYKEVIASCDNLPESIFAGRTLGIWKGIFSIATLCSREQQHCCPDYKTCKKKCEYKNPHVESHETKEEGCPECCTVEDDIYSEMLTFADDNKAYIEAETEDDIGQPRKIIKSLIELVEQNSGQEWFTPGELFNYLKSHLGLRFPTAIGMGMMLGKLGLHSRCLNDKRFYQLKKEDLELKLGGRN